MSRPSSLVRSRPRLFLPRLACSMSTRDLAAEPGDAGRAEAAGRVTAGDVLDLDHLGTPVGEDADAAGTKVCSATSRMRMPSITFGMVRERTGCASAGDRDEWTVGSFPICKNVLSAWTTGRGIR